MAKAAEDTATLADSQWWIGLAQAFLSAFAVAAAAYAAIEAGRAARAANKSAEVAERALVDLERPQIVINVASSGMTVRNGQLGFGSEGFHYQFVNYGRTVAQIVDLNLRYPVVPKPGMPSPLSPNDSQDRRILPLGVVSAPGAPYQESENLFSIFGGVLLNPGDMRKKRLFFMGCVRYRDIFGSVFVAGFCFLFDPVGERFVRWGDEPYNYIKQERKAR